MIWNSKDASLDASLKYNLANHKIIEYSFAYLNA